jgi:hypothetical protein
MKKFKAPVEIRRLKSIVHELRGYYKLPAILNLHVVNEGDTVPPECLASGDAIPRENWGKVINWAIILTED